MNRKSLVKICITLSFCLCAVSSSMAQGSKNLIGPLVGHTDENSVVLWARVQSIGEYTMEIAPGKNASSKEKQSLTAIASEANDYCVKWHFKNLNPKTQYIYKLKKGNKSIARGKKYHFMTAPKAGTPAKVAIAFGSGSSRGNGDKDVWNRIAKSNVDGFLLLGDTPYIDTTNLKKQRSRYLDFNSANGFQNATHAMSFWGTWDDHDFGRNDSDGTLKGKENSRKAFIEYRPNATFGEKDKGIYTKFRYGPIEVFVLDTRWWSWTGPSFADPTKKTLLGKQQWEWLKKELKNSDAPFKLLACGMIWDDKKNGEKDDWGTYMHERDALFQFIGKNKIAGVVLIGGDIHVSRALRYKTEKTVGYPLYQFITSPLHNRVIRSLNVPHPDLIRDAVKPYTFLKVTVDTTVKPAVLTAEFIDKDGKKLFHDIIIDRKALTPNISLMK